MGRVRRGRGNGGSSSPAASIRPVPRWRSCGDDSSVRRCSTLTSRPDRPPAPRCPSRPDGQVRGTRLVARVHCPPPDRGSERRPVEGRVRRNPVLARRRAGIRRRASRNGDSHSAGCLAARSDGDLRRRVRSAAGRYVGLRHDRHRRPRSGVRTGHRNAGGRRPEACRPEISSNS